MARFGRGRRRDSLEFPFLSHQIIEYIAALYLLQVGATVKGPASTVGYVAGVLMLLAATFSGRPLGGGRIPRSLHRWLDIALIAGIALSPFVFGFTDNKPALVRLEALAIAMALLVKATNYGYPEVSSGRQIAQGLKQHGPRLAGRAVGRRVARRRTRGPS